MDNALILLRLQVEWGADEALALDPVDRLRPIDTTAAALRPHKAVAPDPANAVAPGAAKAISKGTPAEQAVALAGQSATLDDLRTAVAGFELCALRATASNLVFAEGDPAAATLIIGEPPGREEDRSGHPFAGPEGQLLDQMFASIGLVRAEMMLTPLLPWRPPGGRPPSAGEIAICLPFLHRLIALLSPRRTILFGTSAARVLLPQAQNRRRTPRGWVDVSIPGMSSTLPVLGAPGLADMLKNPSLRRDAWAVLRQLRRSIDSIPTQT